MEKKYSLMQNMRYVLDGVWKYNRVILLLIPLNTLVTAVSPFIGILFPGRYWTNCLRQSARRDCACCWRHFCWHLPRQPTLPSA